MSPAAVRRVGSVVQLALAWSSSVRSLARTAYSVNTVLHCSVDGAVTDEPAECNHRPQDPAPAHAGTQKHCPNYGCPPAPNRTAADFKIVRRRSSVFSRPNSAIRSRSTRGTPGRLPSATSASISQRRKV
jgi:hypothetical protein